LFAFEFCERLFGAFEEFRDLGSDFIGEIALCFFHFRLCDQFEVLFISSTYTEREGGEVRG
jgi:hypothetical protein